VVLALVGAATLVVWLARTDEDGRAPVARSGPRDTRAGRTTPVVDLAPPSSSSAASSIDEAPSRTAARPVSGSRSPTAEPGRVRSEEALAAARALDPAPSIRGVRGLVRDARTGLPIAHAWITWVPLSHGIADDVLSRVGPEEVATGMVTGADGRFEVDRLPDDQRVSSTLHAVAAGYAATGLRPGLREDVVFDLQPMGSLEVREQLPAGSRVQQAAAGRGARLVTIEPVPEDLTRPTEFVAVIEPLHLARASHLAPGRWRVRFPGAEPRIVDVTAGATTVVEIAAAPQAVVEGTVVGAGTGSLLLVSVDEDEGSAPLSLPLTEGTFHARLDVGRYRATLTLDADRQTERRLPDVVEVRPGESRLVLHAPPAGDEVQIRLTRAGRPYSSASLGLVALDEATRGSLIALAASDPGVHVGQAPAGRFALFDGQRLLAGDLSLPVAGGLVVAADLAEVRVRFALPAGLRSEEVLRGKVSWIPGVLSGDLARRFAEAEQSTLRLTRDASVVTFEIAAPGRYLLTGETDLGPFEAWVDLAPGVEVTIPLEE
jgi:hypothetical protein